MVESSIFQKISDGLSEEGYAVLTGIFSGEICAEVRAEVAELQSSRKLRPAGIGQGATNQMNSDVRGDATAWFVPGRLSPVQTIIWNWLEELKRELNSKLFLGLWDFEGHYAVYSEGAFYRTHFDRFKNDSKRTVSVVLFFNEKWERESGGALRLETPRGDLRILPEAGTAVIFLSDRIAHEVELTHRDRVSFAGWLKTRP